MSNAKDELDTLLRWADETKSEVEQLKAELVSYHRMAAEGVWIPSMDYAQIVEERERYRQALEDIANHKQDSVDKVDLIHQCKGYQERARRALAPAAEGREK